MTPCIICNNRRKGVISIKDTDYRNNSLSYDGYEKKKRYLKRYQRSVIKTQRLTDRLDMILKGRDYEELTGYDKLVYDETKMRIKHMNADNLRLRKETYQIIDTLDDFNEIEVLEAFFIFNMTFQEIAEEKGYSERHIIRTYSRGLRRIDDRLCDPRK